MQIEKTTQHYIVARPRKPAGHISLVTDDGETLDYMEITQILPQEKIGNLSDGFHTFNELYEYRMLYHAAACDSWLDIGYKVVKSKRHHDGEECFGGGWFVVSAQLPTGQVTNHYELKYWDLFIMPEVERAPEWDGHTPAQAADRLRKYLLGERNQGELQCPPL